MKFIIQDWAGNHMFPDKVFDSFEDGWGFLYEQFPEDGGTLDDIFVVPINNN